MIKEFLKKDEYIVLAILRRFCKENNLGTIQLREEGINKVEEFGKRNTKIVNDWLDTIVKQGRKYSYIKEIRFNKEMYSSELFWKRIIDNEFKSRSMKTINEVVFNSNNLTIENIKLYKEEKVISNIEFMIGMLVYEEKKITGTNEILYDKLSYPIFVNLNTLKGVLEIRLKSKAKIYEISTEQDAIEVRGKKITTDYMANKVVKFLKSKLNFAEEALDKTRFNFFSSFYILLDELTETPRAILDKVDENKTYTNKFVEQMFLSMGLDSNYKDIAKDDLTMWLEKFISLSQKDKSIFTENKDGYPIKLIATDLEDTRVEETSADEQPLQTKASYFDHKKILKKEKVCDGMTLAFKRKETLYYGKSPFIFTVYYKNGFGIVNFTEYVEEEDIQNVLSRIIRNL